MQSFAIGYDLAWEIVDAFMYLINNLNERGQCILNLRVVRAAKNPEVAQCSIAEALPSPVASILQRGKIEPFVRGGVSYPNRLPNRVWISRIFRCGGHILNRFSVNLSGSNSLHLHSHSAAGSTHLQFYRNRDPFSKLGSMLVAIATAGGMKDDKSKETMAFSGLSGEIYIENNATIYKI
jgi:hypothetical protein